jgi:hypothetical protein
MIDPKNGGSIERGNQGAQRHPQPHELRARRRGGTYVVPGHGFPRRRARGRGIPRHGGDCPRPREGDGQRGATLAQVKAARLSADYDTRYGQNTGPWTTDMFVEAVYNSLKPAPKTN